MSVRPDPPASRAPRPALAAAPAGIIASDLLRRRKTRPLVVEGLLDEASHLATGALALKALSRDPSREFSTSFLLASVAIDVDHVSIYLGINRLGQDTPRPYPHSLLTLLCIGFLATLWPRRRQALLGALAGTALHLLRDTCEPGDGVPLLWPLSKRSLSLGYAWYAIAICVLTIRVCRACSVELATPSLEPAPPARAAN